MTVIEMIRLIAPEFAIPGFIIKVIQHLFENPVDPIYTNTVLKIIVEEKKYLREQRINTHILGNHYSILLQRERTEQVITILLEPRKQ